MEKEYYFDNISASRIDDSVLEAMLPFLKQEYGNAQSFHNKGQSAKKAIEQAREQVASLINAKHDEIFFTSCVSESNNWVLKSLSAVSKNKKTIITSSIEHHSILNPLKTLKKQGANFIQVKVDSQGFIDLDDFKSKLNEDVFLVTIQHANNEIGTVQNLKEIINIAKEKDILVHSDGAAAVGKIPIDIKDLNIDFYSFSPLSFNGPKGIAALYIKKGNRLLPLIEGGIQENGRRAGTENTAAIVGFGKSCEIIKNNLNETIKKLTQINKLLIEKMPEKVKDCIITGPVDISKRIPGHSSFCFKFVEGEAILLMLNFKKIYATSGSACTSKALKASHVLLSIGLDHATAQGSIVFSADKYNTIEDAQYILDNIEPVISRLREMSCLK